MPSRAAGGSRWTSALSVKCLHFGYKQNGCCIPPSLYLPDLAPCNFILFPGMNQDILMLQRVNKNHWWPLTDNVSSSGRAALGSLHPVTGVVLWRGLNFQTCMNIVNKFFLKFQEFLGSPSYIHTCIYIYTYVHTYIHTYTHTRIHTHTYMQACLCTYTHQYIHIKLSQRTDFRNYNQDVRQLG